MSQKLKINFDDLKRTNVGFPSVWETSNIKIHYRYGRIKIFVDEKEIMETFVDEFDLGGYLSDDVLKAILQRDKLLKE